MDSEAVLYTKTLHGLYKRLLDNTIADAERAEIEFQIFVLVRGVNLPLLRDHYKHLLDLRESFLANDI
jgi:hypothetical protein